jgi:hypothetical protein
MWFWSGGSAKPERRIIPATDHLGLVDCGGSHPKTHSLDDTECRSRPWQLLLLQSR